MQRYEDIESLKDRAKRMGFPLSLDNIEEIENSVRIKFPEYNSNDNRTSFGVRYCSSIKMVIYIYVDNACVNMAVFYNHEITKIIQCIYSGLKNFKPGLIHQIIIFETLKKKLVDYESGSDVKIIEDRFDRAIIEYSHNGRSGTLTLSRTEFMSLIPHAFRLVNEDSGEMIELDYWLYHYYFDLCIIMYDTSIINGMPVRKYYKDRVRGDFPCEIPGVIFIVSRMIYQGLSGRRDDLVYCCSEDILLNEGNGKKKVYACLRR